MYFGIVGLEDGVDDDYNDGIVFLNWLLGWLMVIMNYCNGDGVCYVLCIVWVVICSFIVVYCVWFGEICLLVMWCGIFYLDEDDML